MNKKTKKRQGKEKREYNKSQIISCQKRKLKIIIKQGKTF